MLHVLQNYNGKLFSCLSQKLAKTQLTFQTAVFPSKFTLNHIKLKIYI